MIRYTSFTDKGSREHNEDAMGVMGNSQCGCFVLCDGLGGHGYGEVASNLAVECFKRQFEHAPDMVNFIGDAILSAQENVMMTQKMNPSYGEMKTTVVALAFDDRKAYIGHVGDSRVYMFYKGKIKNRTLDHSVPQMLVRAGEIKDKHIRNHPDRSLLLRVIGMEWEENKYELQEPVDIKEKQAFLLCSDGFWELITEKEMEKTLKKSKTPEAWCEAMVEIIRKNGVGTNMDNYSAIAVFVD
ncbi:MAG: protein phosphatase 2C domain-containing protein [Lachnospiraceae bacterium]|nr:protein phosphatase 2C domain-containing protein [Lachnospiraceae bacterium]